MSEIFVSVNRLVFSFSSYSLREKPTFIHASHVPHSPNRLISVPETIAEEIGVMTEKSPYHPIMRRTSSSPQRYRNHSGNCSWPKTPPPLLEETTRDSVKVNIPTAVQSRSVDTSVTICDLHSSGGSKSQLRPEHHQHLHTSRTRGFSESRPYFTAKTGNRELDLRRQIATRRLEEFMSDRSQIKKQIDSEAPLRLSIITRRRRSLSDGAEPLSTGDETVSEATEGLTEEQDEEEKPDRITRFNRITKTLRNILTRLRS